MVEKGLEKSAGSCRVLLTMSGVFNLKLKTEAFGGFQTGSSVELEETRVEIKLVAHTDFRTSFILDCKLYAKRCLDFAALTKFSAPSRPL